MTKIIADTLCGLSPQEAARLGIAYLPQIIIFGDQSYRDDSEIDSDTFIKRLRVSPVLPKTAAPPPAFYTPIYQKFAAEGEQMVVIAPATELSGTVRSASVAANDFPEAVIRVVDTHTMAGPLASLVLNAVEWANQGMDAFSIEDRVNEMASRQRVYFLVDTLEFLRKGGRIGGAQALLGSVLQIKPILTLKNGRVEPAESQRTKARALARIHEIVYSDCPPGNESNLSVMHGDAEAEATALAQELGNKLGMTQVPIYKLPPAILVHAGPGVLAVGYFVSK